MGLRIFGRLGVEPGPGCAALHALFIHGPILLEKELCCCRLVAVALPFFCAPPREPGYCLYIKMASMRLDHEQLLQSLTQIHIY